LILSGNPGLELTMPIYEYKCEACGHDFQVVSTIAEHRRGGAGCPRCRDTMVALTHPDFHACEGRLNLCVDAPVKPEALHPFQDGLPQF
jgi:putative FmdB family regulatory protein